MGFVNDNPLQSFNNERTQMLKQLRILLLLGIGVLTSYRIIEGTDHQGVFDGIINRTLTIVSLLLWIWTIIQDYKQYKSSLQLFSFLSSILFMLLMAGLMLILFVLAKRDSSPSRLYAITEQNDFNRVSIDFREDNTYKITSWCLGMDAYRGTYEQKDSLIYINLDPSNKALVSSYLLLRTTHIKDSFNNPVQYLYQIDQSGHIIKGVSMFRVSVRKNHNEK